MGELRIGSLAIPGVPEGGARVLSERGFLSAIGLCRSGAVHTRAQEDSTDGAQLPLLVPHTDLKPFVDEGLEAVLSRPIWYKPVGKRNTREGVSAILIPRALDVGLRARSGASCGAG